jgi:hypothetical protein
MFREIHIFVDKGSKDEEKETNKTCQRPVEKENESGERQTK